MEFLWFILVGLVAGWLAGQIMRGGGFGLIGNIVVGILGALIGGFVFGLFGTGADNLLGSIIVATIGAVILLWIITFFRKTP